MKRYQNPEIFEYLAMSYALGTLQGRSRQRFESLLAKHLYLRTVTDFYQHQFATLGEFIPPEPVPMQIWQRIESYIKAEQNAAKPSVWQRIKARLSWPLTAVLASLVALVFAGLLMSQPSPHTYVATLKSPLHSDKMVTALVQYEPMQLALDMPSETFAGSEGYLPTIWCIAKDKSQAPMRMGTLAREGEIRLPIDMKTWKMMPQVAEFAISLEPMDNLNGTTPKGEIIFRGAVRVL